MQFTDWLNKKKLMWSPEEWDAIQANHPQQIEEATRVWEDDERGLKRRPLICIAEIGITDSRQIHKALDPISANEIYQWDLSPTGEEPATYGRFGWDMMPSEIGLFQSELAKNQDRNQVRIFINQDMEHALQVTGLKIIAPPDPVGERLKGD